MNFCTVSSLLLLRDSRDVGTQDPVEEALRDAEPSHRLVGGPWLHQDFDHDQKERAGDEPPHGRYFPSAPLFRNFARQVFLTPAVPPEKNGRATHPQNSSASMKPVASPGTLIERARGVDGPLLRLCEYLLLSKERSSFSSPSSSAGGADSGAS